LLGGLLEESNLLQPHAAAAIQHARTHVETEEKSKHAHQNSDSRASMRANGQQL